MADPLYPPDAVRSAVVCALSFTNPTTPAGLQAFAADLDQSHGDQAALGLDAASL